MQVTKLARSIPCADPSYPHVRTATFQQQQRRSTRRAPRYKSTKWDPSEEACRPQWAVQHKSFVAEPATQPPVENFSNSPQISNSIAKLCAQQIHALIAQGGSLPVVPQAQLQGILQHPQVHQHIQRKITELKSQLASLLHHNAVTVGSKRSYDPGPETKSLSTAPTTAANLEANACPIGKRTKTDCMSKELRCRLKKQTQPRRDGAQKTSTSSQTNLVAERTIGELNGLLEVPTTALRHIQNYAPRGDARKFCAQTQTHLSSIPNEICDTIIASTMSDTSSIFKMKYINDPGLPPCDPFM